MKSKYKLSDSIRKLVIEILVPVFVGLLMATLLKSFIITSANVNGTSMEPNLENNEKVLVWRRAPIRHLSVIVFNAYGEDPNATSKNDYYIKRVIGLPGDRVSFNNNKLYLNGKVINQNFINNNQKTIGTRAHKNVKNWDIHSLSSNWTKDRNSFTVPNNKYFVLGDHRSVSNDSRYWGFVNTSEVMGVANTIPFTGDSNKSYNINSLSY